MKTFNILTRTSGRPKAFKRCVNSIKNQTYGNINHIIITDSIGNVNYIKDNGCENFTILDRDEIINNDKSINPNTGKYSPHNLYFNQVKDKVVDGWLMYLDDDDYLTDSNVIENIYNEINLVDEDTIIYWKMLLPNGKSLPIIINESNPPKLTGIGSPCFCINIKWLDGIVWDGWKCSDYRVINKLHNTIPKYKWLNKVMVIIPSVGLGNKNDANE